MHAVATQLGGRPLLVGSVHGGFHTLDWRGSCDLLGGSSGIKDIPT